MEAVLPRTSSMVFLTEYHISNKKRGSLGSGIRLQQFLPVLGSPAGMRNHDGATNDIGHGKDLIHLIGSHTKFVTLTQVILDAIITTEDHAGHQTKHFLGGLVQCSGIIRVGIQIPKPFKHQVVFAEDDFVHARAVVVEFLN
jgi:hypothetical protein